MTSSCPNADQLEARRNEEHPIGDVGSPVGYLTDGDTFVAINRTPDRRSFVANRALVSAVRKAEGNRSKSDKANAALSRGTTPLMITGGFIRLKRSVLGPAKVASGASDPGPAGIRSDLLRLLHAPRKTATPCRPFFTPRRNQRRPPAVAKRLWRVRETFLQLSDVSRKFPKARLQ